MNHSYVGTEHQLLALFDVGGVAVQAMTDLGVTREAAATEVTELAAPGTEPTGPPESLPFTPRARVVLEQALNVAVELAHNYIGTEHLLLALYRGQGGIGLQVLEKLGASRDAAKDKVLALLEGFKPA